MGQASVIAHKAVSQKQALASLTEMHMEDCTMALEADFRMLTVLPKHH